MILKRQIQGDISITDQDLNQRLKRTLQAALKIHAQHNVPLVYKDARCISENQFIHQYPDGRIFLIQQKLRPTKEIVVKQL